MVTIVSKKELNNLKAENAGLKARISGLKARISGLERQLDESNERIAAYDKNEAEKKILKSWLCNPYSVLEEKKNG